MHDHSGRPPNHPDLTDPADIEVRLFEIDAIDPAEKILPDFSPARGIHFSPIKSEEELRAVLGLYRVACGYHFD